MTGMVGVLRTSARVWVPVALGVTIAQTLLVLGDPVPLVSPAFVALTLGSGGAFSIGLWLVSRALGLAGTNSPVRWRSVLRAHPSLLWAIVVVVAFVLLTLLSPYITVIALWFGLLVMPVAAAGASNPFPGAWSTVRHRPARVIFGAVLVAIVWALCGFGMLLLGFFVTGPLAAALTWLALTLVATVLLAAWTQLHREALPGVTA